MSIFKIAFYQVQVLITSQNHMRVTFHHDIGYGHQQLLGLLQLHDHYTFILLLSHAANCMTTTAIAHIPDGHVELQWYT